MKTLIRARLAEQLTSKITATVFSKSQVELVKGDRDGFIGDALLGDMERPLVTSMGAALHRFSAMPLLRWCATGNDASRRAEEEISIDVVYGPSHSVTLPMTWSDIQKEYGKDGEKSDDGEKNLLLSLTEPVFGFVARLKVRKYHDVIGNVYSPLRVSKKLAIQSAALQACKRMYHSSLLDDHLLPIDLKNRKFGTFHTARQFPNANLNPPNKKQKLFVEPLVAEKDIPLAFQATPESLISSTRYVTVLNFETNHTSSFDVFCNSPSHCVESLAILTHQAIDPTHFPPLELYEQGKPIQISFKCFNDTQPRTFSESEWTRIRDFQSKFWNYLYKVPVPEVPLTTGRLFGETETRQYDIVPLIQTNSKWEINWFLIDLVLECKLLTTLQITTACLELLSEQKKISSNSQPSLYQVYRHKLDLPTHPSDFLHLASNHKSRHLIESCMSECLVMTPHNSFKYQVREIDFERDAFSTFNKKNRERMTFLSYFEGRGYVIGQPTASLLNATMIPNVEDCAANHVIEKDVEEKSTTNRFPQEVPLVLPFSKQLIGLSRMFPTILYHLSLRCQVDEFMTKVGYVDHKLMLEAFVSSTAQHSMDYERLETMGDAFLKFGVTLYLFNANSGVNEGKLSTLRGRLVSNAHLYDTAMAKDMQGLMTVRPFAPRFWAPPNTKPWTLDALSPDSEIEQPPARKISVKTLADFVESTIGAYFIGQGQEYAFKYLKVLGLVQEMSPRILPSVLYKPGYILELESALNYSFKHPSLVPESLTASILQPGQQNYERLEFLGDAVLDALVMRYFYTTYPKAQPGTLTELRSAAVNAETFARFAVRLKLHTFVMNTSPDQQSKIQEYVAYLASIDPHSDPSLTEHAAPKILGDLFESIVACIFLDCDSNLDATWSVIRPIVVPTYEKFMTADVIEKTPVRRLDEFCAKNGLGRGLVYEYPDVKLDLRVTGKNQCVD